MGTEVTFFLAADDGAAAATRYSGPARDSRSRTFRASFEPEDAVVDWAGYFADPAQPPTDHERYANGDWPRYVAEIQNDGVGVFVVSETLLPALAGAGPEALLGAAARWGEQLVRSNDDEPAGEERLVVLQGVADLAAEAVRSAGELRLYCWRD